MMRKSKKSIGAILLVVCLLVLNGTSAMAASGSATYQSRTVNYYANIESVGSGIVAGVSRVTYTTSAFLYVHERINTKYGNQTDYSTNSVEKYGLAASVSATPPSGWSISSIIAEYQVNNSTIYRLTAK